MIKSNYIAWFITTFIACCFLSVVAANTPQWQPAPLPQQHNNTARLTKKKKTAQLQHSVLFWNLNNYNLSVSKQKNKAITAIICQQKPTIILLCEVANKAAAKKLQQQLNKKTANYYRYMDLSQDKYSRHKLVVISHVKITQTISYRPPRTSQLYLQRPFLEMYFTIAGTKICCIATHFKSSHISSKQKFSSKTIRQYEAKILRQRIMQLLRKNKQLPIIVCGDFNTTRNTLTIRRLKGRKGHASALHEVFLRDKKQQVWTHYWQKAATYSKLDYFFLAGQKQYFYPYHATIISLPPLAPSDHRPILLKW